MRQEPYASKVNALWPVSDREVELKILEDNSIALMERYAARAGRMSADRKNAVWEKRHKRVAWPRQPHAQKHPFSRLRPLLVARQ